MLRPLLRHTFTVHSLCRVMRYELLGHPVVAVAASLAVVLTAGVAASKLTAGGSTQQVEKVAVPKRIMVQPMLKLNVPSDGEAGATATRGPDPEAPSLAAPQIARVGKVSLYTNSVEAAVSALSRLARRSGGDVFSLEVANEDAGAGASATMDIRIPENRFDSAMNALPRIGKIRERSVSAQDLTGDIDDSAARLRNLRQTEADIRKIMDRSGDVAQIMDAENQLSAVRGQIETLESDIASMRGRVAYSTISLDVQAEVAGAPVEPTVSAQVTGAWQAALHSVSQFTVGLVALGLWLLVFAPYAALAALALWLLFAQMRKRLHPLPPA